MPIYEYICKKCNNKFELMRPYSKSQEGAICPKCQNQADRVLSRCNSVSTNEYGVTSQVGGGGGCASCSSGSCTSCGSNN